MSNTLATAAQLEAAFATVIRAEIKSELKNAQIVCKAKITPALQQEPWKTFLIKAFNVESTKIAADLDGRVAAAATSCVAELNTSIPQHGTKAADATDADLASLSNANHVFFFSNVVLYTKFWTDTAAKAGPSLEAVFDGLVTKAKKFSEAAVTLYEDLQKKLLTADKRMSELFDASNAIVSDAALKKFFLPLVDDASEQRDAAIAIIKSNDPSVLQTRLANLAETRPLAVLNYTEISNVAYYMTQDVIFGTITLSDLLQRIDIQRLQALKALLSSDANITLWYGNFLEDYGAAAAYSLIPLPDINIRAFLDLYAGGSYVSFTMDFKKNLPAGTHFSVLTLCVAAGAGNVVGAPGGYNHANLTPNKRQAAAAVAVQPVSNRIVLPPNVTALGWRAVGLVIYPLGFSTNQFSTDLACLKHVKDETGNAPSKAKLAAYFEEVVLACTAAKNSGVPGSYKGRQANWRAEWNILVKTGGDGKPEIYHVDSGYDKSPWKTAVI